jgi:hypothetical protein
MESFLKDNLLELRQCLWNGKYCVASDDQATFVGPFLAPAVDHASPPQSKSHASVVRHISCLRTLHTAVS